MSLWFQKKVSVWFSKVSAEAEENISYMKQLTHEKNYIDWYLT